MPNEAGLLLNLTLKIDIEARMYIVEIIPANIIEKRVILLLKVDFPKSPKCSLSN
jgi:hypothetical protein